MNKEIEKAKEDLSFFNEGDYITKDMANSARVLEEYIKQLEFNAKAAEKEHKYDMDMIDKAKGEVVRLHKERDKLKEELEMYKDIKEVANMKLDRLTNPIQQLEVNVMLDRQCKRLKSKLDKIINKLKQLDKKYTREYNRITENMEMTQVKVSVLQELNCIIEDLKDTLNIIEGEEENDKRNKSYN